MKREGRIVLINHAYQTENTKGRDHTANECVRGSSRVKGAMLSARRPGKSFNRVTTLLVRAYTRHRLSFQNISFIEALFMYLAHFNMHASWSRLI